MKNVFIDCGAYNGNSVRKFIENNNYEGFLFYCFEPNKTFKKDILKLRENVSLCYLDKACWINNRKRKLRIGLKANNVSSTLMQDKKIKGKVKLRSIECIDFSLWLKETFEPKESNDFIVLKMNIEGAEYPVLEKMIEDDAIKLIDEFYINWHWVKMEEITEERHNKLFKAIKHKPWNCYND